MEYKVTMPILSDTMDKGKLIKWYVTVGDKVKKGDKLAEIESDKATMDIQSFVDGVVSQILVKENSEVAVKSVIAVIDKNMIKSETNTQKQENKNTDTTQVKSTKKVEKQIEKTTPKSQQKQNDTFDFDLDDIINSIVNDDKNNYGIASPKAKQKAKEIGIDIQQLQKDNILPTPAHEKDIYEILSKKYFTPKALKLVQEYKIKYNNFTFNHKIDSKEIEKFIKTNNITKETILTQNKKAVIKTLQTSISKPTFFIFEEIEIEQKNVKLTAKILKALANAMQTNFLTRSILRDDKLITYPHSNISVAVSRNDELFMAVIKNTEEKSLEEINLWLKEIKTKKLTIDDLSGSTFGLSNLGMFGIDRFNAVINNNDSGIIAIGALNNNQIKVTFTIDHRILNGVDAAKFVNDFKKEIKCMM